MSEKPRPQDDYDAPDSRRSFVKNAGKAIIGAAAVGSAGYLYAEHEKNSEAEKIAEMLSGEIADVSVPGRYTIDHFYARSGWNERDGCVDSFTYRKAVLQLNEMEDVPLQENQGLKVPIREGQSLEGGE